MDTTLEYIRAYYKVPAREGGRVRVNGRPGTIVGGASGPYLRIRLDGQKIVRTYHPTWEVEYEDTAQAEEASREAREGDGR